jgi:GNAT superfamily N-acetyltransferase
MKLTWDLPLDADGIKGELDDGTPFVIRPLRPTDGPGLEAAFAQMSPRSKYLRFFTVRERLGEELVNSLTDIDHDRHRAWVVADPTAPSDVGTEEGRGFAVARLIVVEDEPKVAEASLAVMDDYQGRGFGRLLLELLIGTAQDAGIEFIRFETLYENRGMRALLSGLDAERNDELSDREVLVYDMPVTEDDSNGVAVGPLYEILRFIASTDDGLD